MYRYSPLIESRNEIRLLDLQPGKLHDDIRCHLHHATLTASLAFTALSYTWGNPTVRKTICIDGDILEVTINLYDALQHMRDPKGIRTLWIDAVCINQADLNERSKQVLRMRDIYAVANTVEVWLGTADDNDMAAMDLVRRLGAIVADPEDALAKGFFSEYEERFLEEFEKSEPQTVKSLSRLFKRPWWTRIWVVQELSLANQEAATVRCGQRTVTWLHFLIAAYAIDSSWFIVNAIICSAFPDERLSAFNNGIRMAQCRRVNRTDPPFTLLDLLHQHRDCESTDPKDKVYGLLGLSGNVDDIGIKPAYSQSTQEVFIDLFRRHVTATNSLDMICAVRFPRKFDDLPSWVPDWSVDQTVTGICINDRYVGGNAFPGSPIAHFEKFSASGTASPRVSFSDNKMSAAGIRFGRIVSLGSVDDGMTFEDIETFGRADENGKSGSDSELFNEWLNMVLDSPIWDKIAIRYGAENVLDTFCRTLVGNRNNRMMKPPEQPEVEAGTERSVSMIWLVIGYSVLTAAARALRRWTIRINKERGMMKAPELAPPRMTMTCHLGPRRVVSFRLQRC
jgi:Heterokaryon incompatibility protein (HET)